MHPCSDEPILRASEVKYYLTAQDHQRIRPWKVVVVAKILVDHVRGLSTCRRWIRWVWCGVVWCGVGCSSNSPHLVEEVVTRVGLQ